MGELDFPHRTGRGDGARHAGTPVGATPAGGRPHATATGRRRPAAWTRGRAPRNVAGLPVRRVPVASSAGRDQPCAAHPALRDGAVGLQAGRRHRGAPRAPLLAPAMLGPVAAGAVLGCVGTGLRHRPRRDARPLSTASPDSRAPPADIRRRSSGDGCFRKSEVVSEFVATDPSRRYTRPFITFGSTTWCASRIALGLMWTVRFSRRTSNASDLSINVTSFAQP